PTYAAELTERHGVIDRAFGVRLYDRAGAQSGHGDIQSVAARPCGRNHNLARIAQGDPKRLSRWIQALGRPDEIVSADGRAESAGIRCEGTRHQMKCIGWNVIVRRR